MWLYTLMTSLVMTFDLVHSTTDVGTKFSQGEGEACFRHPDVKNTFDIGWCKDGLYCASWVANSRGRCKKNEPAGRECGGMLDHKCPDGWYCAEEWGDIPVGVPVNNSEGTCRRTRELAEYLREHTDENNTACVDTEKLETCTNRKDWGCIPTMKLRRQYTAECLRTCDRCAQFPDGPLDVSAHLVTSAPNVGTTTEREGTSTTEREGTTTTERQATSATEHEITTTTKRQGTSTTKRQGRSATDATTAEPDTGGWRMIYILYIGIGIIVVGIALAIWYRRTSQARPNPVPAQMVDAAANG